MEMIKIQYLEPDTPRLAYIDGKSDWIDLRAAEDVELKAGEFRLIHLGWPCGFPKDTRRILSREARLLKTSASCRQIIWES